MPVIRVTYSLGENETKASVYVDEKMDEMLQSSRRDRNVAEFPGWYPGADQQSCLWRFTDGHRRHGFGGRQVRAGVGVAQSGDSRRFDFPRQLRLQPDRNHRGARVVRRGIHRPEFRQHRCLRKTASRQDGKTERRKDGRRQVGSNIVVADSVSASAMYSDRVICLSSAAVAKGPQWYNHAPTRERVPDSLEK